MTIIQGDNKYLQFATGKHMERDLTVTRIETAFTLQCHATGEEEFPVHTNCLFAGAVKRTID